MPRGLAGNPTLCTLVGDRPSPRAFFDPGWDDGAFWKPLLGPKWVAIPACLLRSDFSARLLDSEALGKLTLLMSASLPDERWQHDEEAEFFSDIRRQGAAYSYRLLSSPYDLIIDCGDQWARVVVAAKRRRDVEAVFQVVEKLAPQAQLPVSNGAADQRPEKVFIGHGRDEQWRDLKDHLQDKHGLVVLAYEIGERAGHTIRDILEEMLSSSSIAFLVMTGEDETADGGLRARQNVIHETGLFQGRLGFAKAIVLLEDGVEEFSNIHGVQQIRFGKDAIKETFGDVIAAIRREFPNNIA